MSARLSDRRTVVQDLLEMKRPFAEIARDLNRFPYDCEDDEIVTLTRRQAVRLLDAFIEDRLARRDLEQWGSLIIGRNDIAFEDDSEALKEMVFVLANPDLTSPLDKAVAHEWNLALEAES
jgi:hypothetical protein